MKKYLIVLFILSSIGVYSQTAINSLNISDTRIGGTARYMSLAGSMGALGGDASAIIDNPAALAIYRSSELAFTLDYNSSITSSNWDYNYSASRNRLRFNHFSYIIAVSTFKDMGLLSINFGFSYNKLRDFNRQGKIGGDNQSQSLTDYIAKLSSGFEAKSVAKDNISVPSLTVLGKESFLLHQDKGTFDWYSMLTANEKINQKNLFEEKGSIGDYCFSLAFNYNHQFYWGVNLDINTIDYQMEEEYYESFEKGGGLLLHNNFETVGSGFKISAGMIYRPNNWLRLGFSASTPTYYSLQDNYRSSLTGYQVPLEYNADESIKSYQESASSSVSNSVIYTLRTPYKFQASTGFIFGKRGFINIDYQFSDFKYTPQLSEESEENSIFNDAVYASENDEMQKYGRITHMLRIGGEYRFATHYSLRAGYAFKTPIMSSHMVQNIMSNTSYTKVGYMKDKGTMYYSLGFGYRYNAFGIDLAYLLQSNMQSYTPFDSKAILYDNDKRFGVNNSTNDYSLADIKTRQSHFVVTLSYKM